MVDTAVEQLHRASSFNEQQQQAKQTWLPRTQIAALVVRTGEALALAQGGGGGEGVSNLVAAAEEGLATLGKVFRLHDGHVGDAEASLGIGTAVAAVVAAPGGFGGGGFGGGFGASAGGGGGGGFRFG